MRPARARCPRRALRGRQRSAPRRAAGAPSTAWAARIESPVRYPQPRYSCAFRHQLVPRLCLGADGQACLGDGEQRQRGAGVRSYAPAQQPAFDEGLEPVELLEGLVGVRASRDLRELRGYRWKVQLATLYTAAAVLEARRGGPWAMTSPGPACRRACSALDGAESALPRCAWRVASGPDPRRERCTPARRSRACRRQSTGAPRSQAPSSRCEVTSGRRQSRRRSARQCPFHPREHRREPTVSGTVLRTVLPIRSGR
jgi:hypothetical protein